MTAQARSLSMEEVKAHKTLKDIWIVIDNNVYDVSNFVDEHPGGADSIMDYAGGDATQAFEDVGHSSDARDLLKKMKIGQLNPNKAPPCKGYWPWALAVLAGALVAGFVVKKYYA